jgi:hypothetical protein
MGEYPSKDFAVRLWDGTIWPKNSQQSEQHPAFTLVLSHPGSLRSMFLPPTELTLGEAYIYGNFDVEGDLIAAFSQHYVFTPSHCAIGFGSWKTIMSRLYAMWRHIGYGTCHLQCDPHRELQLKFVGTHDQNPFPGEAI